ENGYLTLQEEDLDFLVSYTRMFLLCWMSERHGAAGENLRKGIYQFAQQLYYFTNDAGHSEINSYLEYLDD
ncbi:MAG: hypothetical protein GWN14_00955, partial [candidate division Zixibacteria bacterium]|nr:hypothetical protein [candidate division Zixibacteria bacterium]